MYLELLVATVSIRVKSLHLGIQASSYQAMATRVFSWPPSPRAFGGGRAGASARPPGGSLVWDAPTAAAAPTLPSTVLGAGALFVSSTAADRAVVEPHGGVDPALVAAVSSLAIASATLPSAMNEDHARISNLWETLSYMQVGC